jgi:ubiquinone/menaquinone biosynthesis C-methylase UbiE
MLSDRIKHYQTDAEVFDYFDVPNPAIAEEEKRRMQFLKRVIKFPVNSLVMDCGSGNGWIAREYLALDVKIVSIDISLKNLAQIRKQYDSRQFGFYVVADLYNLPFKNDVFDGATSNDVFEHLEKPESVAADISRCLKLGAKLFVSVPYCENIVYYLCVHCNQPTPINAHLHSFDENSLSKIFSTANYRIFSMRKFINKGLSLTLIYYFLCRWMPYWLWRSIDILANLIVRKQERICLTMVRI